MGVHEYIYKLYITGGLALIPLEITADDHHIGGETGVIYFKEYDRYRGSTNIRWFPSCNTIIMERVENPDHTHYRNRDEQ